MTPKVYDCFCFLDELDILECRLEYLKNHVDVVVIAQSYVTHRGLPWSPMITDDHALIKKYSTEIDFRLINSYGKETSPWGREKEQRRALDRGLRDVKSSDLVIISDVDEIPLLESIESAKAKSVSGNFATRGYQNYPNTSVKGKTVWRHGKIIRGENLVSCQEHRETLYDHTFPGVGHHFTSIQGVLGWQKKASVSPHEKEFSKQKTEDSLLIEICLLIDAYPSRLNVVSWNSGLLHFTPVHKLTGSAIVLFALRPHWFKQAPSSLFKFERIAILVLIYILGPQQVAKFFFSKEVHALNAENHRIKRIRLGVISPLLLTLFYSLFPLRLFSLLKRKVLIRTYIKKVLRRFSS